MTFDLKRFELLGELGDGDVANLLDAMEERRLEEGCVLFQAGQEADAMYFLIEGTLRIEHEGRALGHLNAGEVLGVVSLVQIRRRECDAVAHDACKLLQLSREAYFRLRADMPGIALALQEGILRSFAGHVRVAVADRRRA